MYEKNTPESLNYGLNYNDLFERYPLPQKTNSNIKQYLGEKEKIDYQNSRMFEEYCLVTVRKVQENGTEKRDRYIFLKNIKGSLHFLYSSKDLIEDYESNKCKFVHFNDYDPNTYIHLAISYFIGYPITNFTQAIEKFLIRNPKARSFNVINEIYKITWFFLEPFMGIAFLARAFEKIIFLEELSIVYQYMGDYYPKVFSKNYCYGYAFLLLEQYNKATDLLALCDNSKDKYYWALGMKYWASNNTTHAIKSFHKAKDNKYIVFTKFMNYLIGTILSDNKIMSMSSQISLYNKLHEEESFRTENLYKTSNLKKVEHNIMKDMFDNIELIKQKINLLSLPSIQITEKGLHSQYTDFITDYLVTIKPGLKRKGLLFINEKQLKISSIESDLCVTMGKKSKKDWESIDEIDPDQVGWISYDTFRNSVSKWYSRIIKGEKTEPKNKTNEVIDNTEIIKAINRLNKKIRETLDLHIPEEDFIENGNKYGWSGHYRFRLHPSFLKIEN
ncbi:MAG: hypothetical protein HOC71_09810 [Candidatus Latescibacteria bacterium]|jgi:hypothetical protein|nr:hypothetical protein [Candidatus Latescibacterota bacterium]